LERDDVPELLELGDEPAGGPFALALFGRRVRGRGSVQLAGAEHGLSRDQLGQVALSRLVEE
jgi:hypothetical protein